ncbi:alpha/beta hydrolase fold [Nocardioides terrae]|uniref:Alpha/beta hydrolase fold n=1 Tax=Nocardioides terrae TaxID=574651 RepID=A0A1I1KKC3_9ACTN|nr:alpha/beta hydrolase [Nocardioides terrae]SFC61326.1 alpha/beta hydrolase fold [Nocardioides terrae]
MRRVLSVVAGAVLVSSGLATATAQAQPAGHPGKGGHGHHTPATPAYTPPPIDWGTCPTASLQNAGAQCGYVTVPLDYAHPRGQKIQLYVSRIEHKTSDADAQGPMLTNPGGPGGSGLGLSRLGASVPDHGGDPFDWIGFDPRGVGRSIPSLSCDPSYFKAGRPAYEPGPGIEKFWLDKAAGYAADCDEAGGALLDHDRTTDWVNDMESIRKALGARKINYYGFSYGTYLGQVYATLHPDRVGKFVLDGVIGASQAWYELNLEQEKQFDPNIDTFFDWIADNDASYRLGTDGKAVRQIYYDTLADLTAHPQADFGPSDWNDIFVGAAYYVYDWDFYAHVLAAAAGGDLAPAKEAYGAPDDATYATYMAVECSDAPWPSWRTQRRDAFKVAAQAPFLAWNNTWYNAPCLTWPAPSTRPVRVDGRKVPPILLIEETNDAATPMEGALEARRTFPRSVMIEGVGGTTHAGSLSGVSCTDDKIADYLLTGHLPRRKPGNRSDAQCDPVPPPAATPVEGAAASAKAGAAAHQRVGGLRRQIMEAAMPQP